MWAEGSFDAVADEAFRLWTEDKLFDHKLTVADAEGVPGDVDEVNEEDLLGQDEQDEGLDSETAAECALSDPHERDISAAADVRKAVQRSERVFYLKWVYG